ncbi:MAG: hypothetical protein IT423_04580, partial [Pirellulaceae bacterium]|nr:hypothetical protein [Pirellulaceae bacterium]
MRSRNPQAADDNLRDWVIQARECGVSFPDHLIEEYDEFFVAPNAEKRVPRVVGLLVKKSLFRSGKKLGLVTPLRVSPSTQS